MIKLVLDKYDKNNERLFTIDDEDSSSKDENKQYNHNIESNESYCKYCLSKLASFQIDFDKSIQLCPNIECTRFKNNSNDLSLYHFELIENGPKANSNEHCLANDPVYLESVLSNFTSLANKIVDQGFERYQNHSVNVRGEILNINNDNLNLVNHSLNNEKNQNNQSEIISRSNDLDTKQRIHQQQSFLFNDNFFSDINSLLTQDYENTDNCVISNNSENVNYLNNNNNQETIDWTMTFGATTENGPNLENNFFDFMDHQQTTSHLEPLKPTNTSKLAAQLASDSLSNDFLDNFLGDDQTKEYSPSFIPSLDLNEEIIANAKTKNGESGILITKKRTTNKTDQFINTKKQTGPFEVAISASKLKLADGEDLELLELISNQNSSVLPKSQPPVAKSHIVETKTFESSPKKLLSWEIKNKDFKRKAKTQNVQDESSKTSTSSSAPFSPSQNKLNGLSAMSRYQNSITKADLSQKSKKLECDLKEKGAELKQALLQNQSFLSSSTTATTSFSKNSGQQTKPPGLGYKDLVLSVLKKKTTT